jgi:hypothetical protein
MVGLTQNATQPVLLPPMESFRVLGLEAVEPAYGQFQGSMYAGLIPVAHESPGRKVEGDMMFWLFEPETQEVENTLVLWLNGGPGCSVGLISRKKKGLLLIASVPVNMPAYLFVAL